tara:strand:- start:145 stop:453 length:309 start_codon:yes stop_codon:yes gene_type:complete
MAMNTTRQDPTLLATMYQANLGRQLANTRFLQNPRTKFNLATRMLVSIMASGGHLEISLRDIYKSLNAETNIEKNGVQYGIWFAKRAGLICKSDRRGIYTVC